MSLAAADRLVRQIIAEAERVIDMRGPEQARAARDLHTLMTRADEDLRKRLLRVPGDADAKFTGAQAVIFRYQANIVLDYVNQRLSGLTREQAEVAIVKGQQHAVRHIARLEKAFTGIATPLRIAEAAQVGAVGRAKTNLLLDRIPTSADRYSEAMRQRIGNVIATGLASGLSKREMVRSIVGATRGGPKGEVSIAAVALPNGTVQRVREENIPEGLFERYEYWATRIVRTEVANAYNSAKLETISEARDEIPDLRKKILATFDNRTAYDSIYVHGQVKSITEPFLDGAGRSYQHPPARPNDRETVIPWRLSWADTQTTAPRSRSEVDAAKSKLGPKARAFSPPDDAGGTRARAKAVGPPPPITRWIREGITDPDELRRKSLEWVALHRR